MEDVIVRNESGIVPLVEIRLDPQRFPRLCKVSFEDAYKAVRGVVFKAFMYRGQAPDDNVIKFTTTSLINEVMKDMDNCGCKYISLEEIDRAVTKAILTDDEQFKYGVNVSSLYKCLVKYCKTEGYKASQEADARGKKIMDENFNKSPLGTVIQAYSEKMNKLVGKR